MLGPSTYPPQAGIIRLAAVNLGQRVAIVREEAEDADGSIEPGRTATMVASVTAKR